MTRVMIDAVAFDALDLESAVEVVVNAACNGVGGWVVTPNLDIMRQLSAHPPLRRYVELASLVLADGMPVVWASHLSGKRLPERVAGSSLVERLLTESAKRGLSVLMVGGGPGVARRAAARILHTHPSLAIVGAITPAQDFDPTGQDAISLAEQVHRARPAIVLVGLGFPKQERLIEELRKVHPSAWYVGCGITLAFLAGDVRRAPVWAQRIGVEWIHRLVQEPRRLAGRYLRRDLPYAFQLLTRSARQDSAFENI